MDVRVWEAALKLNESYGDGISLGGGEPTLHPLFWQFLGESLAAAEYVWLATNGSNTRISLALAGLAKKDVLGVALSRDSYHDNIDDEVVAAFTKKNNQYAGFDNHTPDCREIRNVDGREINGGRCDFGRDGDCVCPGLIIEPDGTIKACGCEDAPIFGTVFDPTIPEGWDINACCRRQETDE